MLAAMIEHVQLVRIEIDAALLVAEERVVFPAIPQARDDIVELAGAFIAHGMIRMLLEVEILSASDSVLDVTRFQPERPPLR